MNTKYMMTGCAMLLAASGLALIFVPDEILVYLSLEGNPILLILLQTTGALYFGFAMLNWMNRRSVIGGIYSKPVVVANLAHFTVAGLALIKALFSDSHRPSAVWMMGVLYSVFAVYFGILFFRNPGKVKEKATQQ